jgi:hypothetical protein
MSQGVDTGSRAAPPSVAWRDTEQIGLAITSFATRFVTAPTPLLESYKHQLVPSLELTLGRA